MQERIIKKIAEEIGIKLWQAEAAAELIDSGSTIPFIARYRKEATGAMDDEALRLFDERLKYLRNLEDRRQTIIAQIDEQGKLTDELRHRIENAETAAALEDLYRPYKPKRKTRADVAREKGLQGLADYLLTLTRLPKRLIISQKKKKCLTQRQHWHLPWISLPGIFPTMRTSGNGSGRRRRPRAC